MRNSSSYNGSESGSSEAAIDWELRPGGMLVQKREVAPGGCGPFIKIKVPHGNYLHEVSVPAQSTFGELKKILSKETGLEPEEQRLLFRGKEKDNEEYLHIAGVKEKSKIVLLEDPASKERKLEQMKRNQGISKAFEAVSVVRAKVNELAEKVSALELRVHRGVKVEEKEFVILTELLMVQLLKLDGIEAEGEAKVQRRVGVRRIQSYMDTLDVLKAANSNPFSNSSSANSVSTQWQMFDSGGGSLSAPPPIAPSRKATND